MATIKKAHRIRLLFWLIAAAFVYLAYQNKNWADVTATLNRISYWGTITTVVALLLAISELLHSISVSRTLQQQTLAVLNDVKRVETASTLSDCIAAIDLITRHLLDERYDAALTGFQHFRKMLVKTGYRFPVMQAADQPLDQLGVLELHLLASTRTTGAAPYSKAQKRDVLVKMLAIKREVEAMNEKNREAV